MVQQVQVYLFGDQTYDVNSRLRDLLFVKGNPILSSFFEQAYYVIRAEIGRLPVKEREAFPKFTWLGDLLTRQREGGLNPAFQTPLTCIYQLGSFIRQHGEGGRSYPTADDTYLLGLCTGALAAAAISSCKTLSELLPAAVQTVLVSFRLGLCVVDVRNRLELSPDNSASWSLVIPGLGAEAAATGLKKFAEANCLPPTTQPCISAYAPKATTITGPPSVLEQLRKEPFLAGMKIKSIPIFVPAHSSQLFSRDDVKSILETTPPKAWLSHASSIPVVSCSTGKLIWAGNFMSLLETALAECLTEPLRWDKICDEFPLTLRSSGASKVKLTPIATTGEQILYSALKEFAKDSADHTKYWPHSSYWPSLGELPSASIELDYQDGTELSDIQGVPSGKSKIAIIGMSGRFPDADSPDAFWDLLRQGLDVAKPVPIKRWNVETHVDPAGQKKNTGATPWGCWLNNPALFDARFFSMSPKEAPQVDPAQRLSLMTTYEALERAGIVPDATPSTQRERFGVFHGVTSNDYMETNSAQDIDTHFIPGGNRAFIPGRINYCFKFGGPSFSVDTACSSSLSALHIACNSLWRGDCDTAIAGGTNMITNPDGHAGLDRGFFLSRTGNCKPFDDGADGYCRGESIVSLVLKRLEDAIIDNDPIQAIILDTNTNHSSESDSITRPHVGAQKVIFDKVLNHAGVDPFKVSYVEMHGTGTQAGDAVEMTSVLDTFAPEVTGHLGRRNENQPLYLGAAKANIGHGEGVSGVTSIAKVLLMMKNNTIPPHCGIKTKINHNYPTDFDVRNVNIAFKPTPWKRYEGETRKVLVNNFSAAGGNSAVLMEDAPIIEIDSSVAADPRTSHIIALSAKCGASLSGNIKSMIAYLSCEHDDEFSLARLSYTTTARRQHFQHRVVVSGSDIKEVKTRLEEALARGDGMNRQKATPKVVFAFTGQGSQYLGMGKQLFKAYSTFRADIRRFDQLAQSQGFPTFQRILVDTDGDIAEFTPLVVQLATTCMQIAMARLWISWGVSPAAVVGHSLGEYAALNITGVLSDSETIYLVGKRAELLQKYCNRGTHSMLAVKASTTEIQKLLAGKKYEIACINGVDDTVLAGPNDQINALQSALAGHQLKMTILKTPYAFHSSQVAPILAAFEDSSRGVTFQKPSIPVICPLFGNIITEKGTFGPNYLTRHCRETVNMRDALLSAQKAKIITDKTVTIEIGPHSVVSGMVKATLGQQMNAFPTLQRGKEPWPLITAALTNLYAGSLDICWTEYQREFKASSRVLELPAYSWDLKEYWIPYENDWVLDKVGLSQGGAKEIARIKPVAKPAPKPEPKAERPAPKIGSTTVHKVVSETLDGKNATVIVESDISRPDLFPIAQGHKVNNIPLCTPSVYADIALSLGKYLLDKYQPEMKERLVDISGLTVESALIPHGKGPQLLHASAKVNWVTKSAECMFYSVDDKRQTTTEHGWCTILFKDKSRLAELQKKAPEYLARIDCLREGIASGRSLRMNSAQGYKFISPLAQFAPDYRAVDEVILDSETLESSSVFSFSRVKKGGSFSTHPAYIDCLTQPGGFVMNCKDSTDLSMEVYVNHGWESFQIYEEINPEKTYQSYVRMGKAKSEGTIWEGDTIIFEGTKVVAFFGGVALRGMPRKFFQMILEAGDTSKSKAKKHLPAPSKAAAQSHNSKATAPKSAPAKPTPPPPAAASSKPTPPVVQAPPKPVAPVAPVAAVPIPKATSKPKVDKVTPALNIVSEESGIALEDLTDDCAFADIGVDSLLSMVIASRFREELGLDLDLEFSIFMDLPTVKHMKDFLDPPSEATETIVEEPKAAIPARTIPEVKTPAVIAPAPAAPAPALVPTPVVAAPKAASRLKEKKDDKVTPALQIVSEESGIAIEDLTDDCAFADIGVDSLLSMVIASRFREELGLDLDLEFSIFMDLPTVKHMKDFLDPPEDADSAEAEEIETSTYEAPAPQVETPVAASVEKTVQAPSPQVAAPVINTVKAPEPTAGTASAESAELIANALQIVSEESGIAVEDLTDDCLFSEIGVDSLLSMVIASRFREELGLDLDLEFSIFLDLPTVKHMKQYFASGGKDKGTGVQEPSSSPDEWDASDISTPNKDSSDEGVESLSSGCSSPPEEEIKPREKGYCRPATSFILQGFPKNAKMTLFLMPDGGGSSSSYVPLPRLSPDCAVVGLNCPYARDAWNLKCHHDDLIDAYVNEIRRRQPNGPYHVGGWSSGGIMAYMVAYKLIKAGEVVTNLVVIDSPVPKIMDRLPTKFHEFCDSIGLFGNAMGTSTPDSTPEWLIPHFNATVEVLADYLAVPLPRGSQMPKMSIIWACEAVLDESVVPPEELVNSKGIHFLIEKRTDFSPCGWEELLPGTEFFLERVEGGNHFTMMQKPLITQVSKFIEKAISS